MVIERNNVGDEVFRGVVLVCWSGGWLLVTVGGGCSVRRLSPALLCDVRKVM